MDRGESIENSWIVHRGKDNVWIVLCDWSKDKGEYTATLKPDLKRLFIPANASAVNWEDRDETFQTDESSYPLKPDILVLSICCGKIGVHAPKWDQPTPVRRSTGRPCRNKNTAC